MEMITHIDTSLGSLLRQEKAFCIRGGRMQKREICPQKLHYVSSNMKFYIKFHLLLIYFIK